MERELLAEPFPSALIHWECSHWIQPRGWGSLGGAALGMALRSPGSGAEDSSLEYFFWKEAGPRAECELQAGSTRPVNKRTWYIKFWF